MPLEKKIKNIIRNSGPISISNYMQISLSDPEHGYYRKKSPIGTRGDFITAPEISQIFGELIATWLISCCQSFKLDTELCLAELGPGRGTLMMDILRVFSKIESFNKSVEVRMIDINEQMIAEQKKKLSAYPDMNIEWKESIDDLPKKPLLLVCNEFFDALPINQFVMTEKGWREKMINLDVDDNLSYSLSNDITPHTALIPKDITKDAPLDSIYEVSPASISIMKQVSSHINKYGGFAIIIDYGYYGNCYKDTFQAIKDHKYHDVLDSPGLADLTAHVDFDYLSNIAKDENLNVYSNTTQGDFLKNMGISIRGSLLSKNSEQKEKIDDDIHRLISSDEMGTLFKCLAITSKDIQQPFGFNYDQG